jgi:hypothetical protein
MIGPWTGAAVDQVGALLPPTHQAVPQPCGLVDALVAIPVALGDDGDWRLEAVSMITLVTPITKKKIIRIPMDISTIRKKLNDGMYKLRDEFRQDVNLIFHNCEIFNEDDSPVGKSGHNMKVFFESRWAELTNN